MSEEKTPADASVRPRKGWRPLQAFTARPRLSIAAAVSVAVGSGLLLAGVAPPVALLLGFDVGALVFLGAVWWLFDSAGTDRMREVARRQDAGRWGMLWSTIGLTAILMLALGTELAAGKSGGVASIAVAGSSIVLSWLFMNVMFALHYAHGFYGDYGEEHKGLDFPGKEEPDYWDFAYFALVIGMTFQVSDVQVTSRYLRRIALMHSVIAFFFNMFVIAVTVNILGGQF
ncbi:DUF1345 domain-containing protein [Luteimonas sp. Y-2-2-4F]|nr:DUF1345 domain-containing protein [Luteimonas sp. Y-2-2-4F]MCD9032950.1 DUF1345 domain-containing protein [Luteimonas sp. Y-2-2-4F]